jgi:hypothetical protein
MPVASVWLLDDFDGKLGGGERRSKIRLQYQNNKPTRAQELLLLVEEIHL